MTSIHQVALAPAASASVHIVDGLDLAGAMVTHKVDIAPADAGAHVFARLDFMARLRRTRSVSRHHTVGRPERPRRIDFGGATATHTVGFAPAHTGGPGEVAVLDVGGAMATHTAGFAPANEWCGDE